MAVVCVSDAKLLGWDAGHDTLVISSATVALSYVSSPS